MKIFTLYNKLFTKLVLLVLLLLQVTVSFGQTTSWIGNSDVWTSASNWTDGVPDTTKDVVIGDANFTKNFQPRIDEKTVINVRKITLTNTGGKAVNLVVSNNFQVNVYGDITIGDGTTFENSGTAIVLKGNLINNGVYKESTFVANQGIKGRFYPSFEMSGLNKYIGGSNVITLSHLVVSGSIRLANNLFIRTMDITFNGNGNNTPPTSDLTIRGTFDPKHYKVTFVGKGASATTPKDDTNKLMVEAGGRLRVMAATYIKNYEAASITDNNLMEATLSAASIVDYAAGKDTLQTILARNYEILKVSRGGTKVLEGNTAVNHISTGSQLVVESGILDLKTYTLDRTGSGAVLGGTLTVANGATLRIGGDKTFPVGYQVRNLGSASLVEYYGQAQSVSNELYGSLHLTSADVTNNEKKLPTTAMTVSGDFSGSGTAIFTALANITVNGNVSLIGSSKFNGGATALTHTIGGNWKNDADFTGGSSTVVLNGSSKTISRTVATAPSLKNEFNNLTITGSEAKIILSPSNSTLTIKGNLATTGAGTLTQTAESLTIAGAASTISGSGITLNDLIIDGTNVSTAASFTVNGNFTTNTGKSFTATGGTITMGGLSKRITADGATTFFGLRISNTDNKTNTSTSFAINSNLSGNGLTADQGTITFGGATATIAGTHNLNMVIVTGADRKMVANANLGIKGTLTVSGTLDVTSNVPNTITYNSTEAQSILGRAYNNIVFVGGGDGSSNTAKTAGSALVVNGDLTISAGSNFNAGNHNHTLNGNWINNGTFTASTGAITFAGTSDAAVSGSSNTVFNTLTVDKAAFSNNITLSKSATTKLLNLTKGWLRTIGSERITVTETRTGTGWVVGTITRTHAFNATDNYAFAGPYNLIKFTNASSITSVTVKNTLSEVSSFTDGSAINRHYDVSILPTGTTYAGEIQLQYDDADLNGNTEAILKVYQDVASNGNWADLTFSSRETTQNWVRKTSINNLSGSWTLSSAAGFKKWTGASNVDNLWTTAGNWDNNQVPTIADIAVVGELGSETMKQPEITSPVDVKGIQFRGNYAITLTMGAGGALAVQGNMSASGVGAGGAKQHYIVTNDKTITVNGNLILSNGSSNNVIDLTIGTGAVIVAGSVTQNTGSEIVFTGNGNLKIKGDYNNNSTATNSFTTANAGTVTYDGTNAQVIAAVPYHNLTVAKTSGAATLTSASALAITGDLVVSNAGTATLALPTLNVDGKVEVMAGALNAGSSTLAVKGNWNVTGGIFTPGTSTVNFTGGNTQSVSATTFNHLVISKTEGTTLTTVGNIKVNANLTIQSGTVSLGTNTMNRSAVGGTFTLADNATLELGNDNFPANFNNNDLKKASLVHYNGTIAQTVAPVTYGKLTFSNESANGAKKVLTSSTRVVSDLTINAGAILDANSQTLTISGDFTNAGSFIPGAYTDVKIAPAGTLVLASTGGLAKSIKGTLTVNNFVIQPAANYNLLNDLTINGNIDIVGTGYVYELPLADPPVPDVAQNGVLDAGSAIVSVAGDFKNSGILMSRGSATFLGVRHQTIQLLAPILPSKDENPTVVFDGEVSPTLNSTRSPQFATVYIKNLGGVTASVGWVIGGEFFVEPGATFDGGPYTHTFYTTFKNSGTFKSSGLIDFVPPFPKWPAGKPLPDAHPFKFGDAADKFVSTGTIRLGGTRQILLYGTVPTSLNNLVIANTIGVTPATVHPSYALTGQEWNLTGNLIVEAGALFNAVPNVASLLPNEENIPNKSFTIGGNLINNGFIVSVDKDKKQIGAGADFIFKGKTSQVSGTGVTTIGGLTVSQDASLDVNSNITMFGNLKHEGTAFNAQGAELTFAGVYPASISTTATTPLSIEYIKIGKTGAATAVTLASNIDAVNSIVVNAGTLDTSDKTITHADGTTGISLTVADAATYKVGGAKALPALQGQPALGMNSTVVYYGGSSYEHIQPVKSVQYGNLTFQNLSLKKFEDGHARIAGNFIVEKEAKVATPETIEYNGSGAQTVAAIDYKNLIISNAGTKTLASGITSVGVNLTSVGSVELDAITNLTTVEYNGSVAQNVLPTDYYNLTLSNTGEKSFSGTTGILKDFVSPPGVKAEMTATSTIDFKGTTDQRIAGVSYKNLWVSGTGIKSLQGDATVGESVLMDAGTIETGSFKLTLGNTASIVGENNNSYIKGKVVTTHTFDGTSGNSETQTQNIAPQATTATSHDFGNIGIQVSTTNNLGTVTVERTTGTPIKSEQTGNFSIARDFSFIVSGENTDLNASVVFSYLDWEVGNLEEEELRLHSFEGGKWIKQAITAPDATNNTLGTQVKTLTRITLGSIVAPLPVELLSFTAIRKGNNAELKWATASEQNNQGFEVQVSEDGKTYQKLGFVESRVGSSATKQEYSFTDTRSSKNGVQYYRLKQIDFDGTYKMYGPKTVNFGNIVATKPAEVYPNPFKDKLRVTISTPAAGLATIKLYTATGRLLKTETLQMQAGVNDNALSMAQAAYEPGLYLVVIELNGQQQTIKLIKE